MIKPGKKHIPESPEAWKAEMDGINRFLAEMKKTKMGEFDYWRKGMVKHYTERRKFLRAHKPRGVK